MAKTIADYSKDYFAAKASGDALGMRNANDEANKLRNAMGEDAQYANTDIAAAASAQDDDGSSGGGSSHHGDYSGLVNDLYKGIEESKLAELHSSYYNSLAELDAEKKQIPETYQAVRNQTTGTSSQEKQNFSEYAAGNGLNSGAGGQADLARSVTLQGNLNLLNQEEANTLADIELQRKQLTNEYHSAIAAAKADGDYELANALYQEKVRAENTLLEYQTTQWSQQQTEKQNQANYGWTILQSGNMPSDSMLEAIGIDKTTAQAIIDSIKIQSTNGW